MPSATKTERKPGAAVPPAAGLLAEASLLTPILARELVRLRHDSTALADPRLEQFWN